MPKLPHRVRAVALALSFALALDPLTTSAFCGFYVGKADARLFNEASQVILVRDGDRTVISMRNDFKGSLSEFALVVPVPVVLQKSQIHVGDPAIFDRIDAYSAPRMAEYFDPDPCAAPIALAAARMMDAATLMAKSEVRRDRANGVTVEARYTIGEYDIAILSATESPGLETWLRQNGYRIPAGASKALAPYVRQNLKFFVARVNLTEQAKTGFSYLRPLQFAFESKRFMLPVRLGMLNAQGPQDLVVYALTRNGRVETTNYRTVKLPADVDLPEYTRDDFAHVYKTMFDTQAKRDDYRTVWTEYFWDMAWCDPCAANPLTQDELRQAGVFWVDSGEPPIAGSAAASGAAAIMQKRGVPAQPVMLTRLHLRYTSATLPEDLMFQETKDRQNFQARYVVHHPWNGDANACPAVAGYLDDLAKRREREAETLANLTGWDINGIRTKMRLQPPVAALWWERLWK